MFNPTLTCPKLIKESHTSVRDSSGGTPHATESEKPGIRCPSFCACRHLQQAGRHRVASSEGTIM